MAQKKIQQSQLDPSISFSSNWGGIGGTLSSQTDLQAALDAKVAGPASSVNNELPLFNGTTGKVVKSGSGIVSPAAEVIRTSTTDGASSSSTFQAVSDGPSPAFAGIRLAHYGGNGADIKLIAGKGSSAAVAASAVSDRLSTLTFNGVNTSLANVTSLQIAPIATVVGASYITSDMVFFSYPAGVSLATFKVHTDATGGSNFVAVTGASTGSVSVSAEGGGANIPLNLISKGTSTVQANGVDVVTTSGTQTMSNKTTDTASGNVIKINGNTLAATAGTATVNIPNANDTLMGRASTDTITGAKTFNNTKLLLAGATSGTTTINATAVAGTTTMIVPAANDTFAALAAAQTMTNKRITPRVGTVASGATITPTGDTADHYTITALAAAATIAAPSGTPTDGQKLVIRIKDNGTARALTWNAIYRVVGTTLPTTTVVSKTVYIGCIYNSADAVWDVVAVNQQA